MISTQNKNSFISLNERKQVITFDKKNNKKDV